MLYRQVCAHILMDTAAYGVAYLQKVIQTFFIGLLSLTHDSIFHFSPPVDGDLSINKLLFMKTRTTKKEAASLVASGPRGCIHFWNVFQVEWPVGTYWSIDHKINGSFPYEDNTDLA